MCRRTNHLSPVDGETNETLICLICLTSLSLFASTVDAQSYSTHARTIPGYEAPPVEKVEPNYNGFQLEVGMVIGLNGNVKTNENGYEDNFSLDLDAGIDLSLMGAFAKYFAVGANFQLRAPGKRHQKWTFIDMGPVLRFRVPIRIGERMIFEPFIQSSAGYTYTPDISSTITYLSGDIGFSFFFSRTMGMNVKVGTRTNSDKTGDISHVQVAAGFSLRI